MSHYHKFLVAGDDKAEWVCECGLDILTFRKRKEGAMACADCDKAAEAREVYWFRWGAANIGIIGCRKDVTEVINALKKAQEERR